MRFAELRLNDPSAAAEVPTTIETDADVEQRARILHGVLFAAFVLLAPCPFTILVASGWAPIIYYAALGLAHPSLLGFLIPAVALYLFVQWKVARGFAGFVAEGERSLRTIAMTIILSVLTIYALFPAYWPVHGDRMPGMNIFEVIGSAFGGAPKGIC